MKEINEDATQASAVQGGRIDIFGSGYNKDTDKKFAEKLLELRDTEDDYILLDNLTVEMIEWLSYNSDLFWELSLEEAWTAITSSMGDHFIKITIDLDVDTGKPYYIVYDNLNSSTVRESDVFTNLDAADNYILDILNSNI